MEESPDEDVENITLEKRKVKEDTIELIANQMYDKITMLINQMIERYGGANMVEAIRGYDCLNLDDNGYLTFTYENEVKNLGNINKGPYSSSRMTKEIGVNRPKLMGDMTYKDVQPTCSKYKDVREKVRKLNDNLNERSEK